MQNQSVVAQREKWEGRGIEGRAGAAQPEIWSPSANPRAPCARVLSGPMAATLRGFVDGLMTRDSDPGPSAPAAESMPARRCDGLPRRPCVSRPQPGTQVLVERRRWPRSESLLAIGGLRRLAAEHCHSARDCMSFIGKLVPGTPLADSCIVVAAARSSPRDGPGPTARPASLAAC